MHSYPRIVTKKGLRKLTMRKDQDSVNVAAQDMKILERYGVVYFLTLKDVLYSVTLHVVCT